MRSFDSLSEREILSLAVSLEEEDELIYGDFADGLREKLVQVAELAEIAGRLVNHALRDLELSLQVADNLGLGGRHDIAHVRLEGMHHRIGVARVPVEDVLQVRHLYLMRYSP